jgi:hypothetical protein
VKSTRMNNSPIVKCSHCRQVLRSTDFGNHECDIPITDSKIIEVAYFRDDSYKNKKLMTGLGLDGVLYTFEVVPREPIPFVLSPSDESYHDPSNRRKVNRTAERYPLSIRTTARPSCDIQIPLL